MFDLELTKENALEDIAGPGILSGQSKMGPEIIALSRHIEEVRNKCFTNAENYQKSFTTLKQLLNQFINAFVNLEIAHFFKQNFHIYENIGVLQQRFGNEIRHTIATFLLESLSNATAKSDNVNVSMYVAPKGVFLDIEQSDGTGFDETFLSDLREKAAEVYSRLNNGTTIQSIALETRHLWRKAIGYVPPNISKEDEDMPYRGNGTRNILLSYLWRTNFVSDASGDHVITLHTSEQLRHADRFQNGDLSVIPYIYAPRGTVKEVPQAVSNDAKTQAIDSLFSQDFDF